MNRKSEVRSHYIENQNREKWGVSLDRKERSDLRRWGDHEEECRGLRRFARNMRAVSHRRNKSGYKGRSRPRSEINSVIRRKVEEK